MRGSMCERESFLAGGGGGGGVAADMGMRNTKYWAESSPLPQKKCEKSDDFS